MSRIELEAIIAAPPERCFDLARSVELHLDSAAATRERAIAGTVSGLLGPGDMVTWEARHFGLRYQLAVQVTAYERPSMFRDEMVSGPFRRLDHEHLFEPLDDGTRMSDVLDFASAFPPFDSLLLVPYLRRFLLNRNATIRRVAETADWRRYLGSTAQS
jgi:ligand-binding SRPBCC domain-containing protein